MKNTWLYYSLISIPLLLLALLINMGMASQLVFVIGLLLYVLLFRPVIDYLRLKSKAKDGDRGKEWMIFIPFYGHFKYFRELYLP